MTNPNLQPFSIKTDRSQFYYLALAVRDWLTAISKAGYHEENSIYRYFHLKELQQKVIGPRMLKADGSPRDNRNIEFRIRITAAQALTIWTCYQTYPGSYGRDLKRILASIDRQLIDRFEIEPV